MQQLETFESELKLGMGEVMEKIEGKHLEKHDKHAGNFFGLPLGEA